MSEPFIAEIKIFAGNFAPRSYALCDGQRLPIAQNTALFSLVGTTYGGDGRTTLGLPDLKGRAPMHPGHGPGLTARRLGEKLGAETVTLTEAEMPSHNHTLQAGVGIGVAGKGNANDPKDNSTSVPSGNAYAPGTTETKTPMSSSAIADIGGGVEHENMQPYLTMNFIIALQGLFPSRS